MNTPSPNSMKRDPGRGSAYLSFLKKRCRDFFFFCLLLGVYVAFITLTGIGCPIRFSTGISCPGCGMSRAVLLMLSGHFRAAFRMHPLVYAVLPAGIWLFFGPEQTAGLRRFKKGIITVLVVLLLAVMPGAFITTTRSFLLTLLSGACYNGSILIKGGIYK